jgi:hypothetical protein
VAVKVERHLKFDLLEAKSQGEWCARDLRRKRRTLAAEASYPTPRGGGSLLIY